MRSYLHGSRIPFFLQEDEMKEVETLADFQNPSRILEHNVGGVMEVNYGQNLEKDEQMTKL